MVAAEAYRAARDALRQAGIEDAAFEADELLRLVTGRGHLQQEAAAPLKEEQAQRFQTLLRRRCERYPLQ